MAAGKALGEYAAEDDLEGFQKIFAQSCAEKSNCNMMYWHVQRAFKEAVKHKSLQVVEHIIEDLDLDLRHEGFKNLLHMFLFTCSMAETVNDPDMQEVNRQLVRYLVRGMKGEVDSMNSANGSTPLHVACDSLCDLTIIEILVDGGADVNAVNNDDEMPLLLLRRRLQKDDQNEQLLDLEEYLMRKGAKTNWRT